MFGYSLIRLGNNKQLFWALLDNLNKFNVPIEGFHTETGPGVMEVAIQFSDALEAADRAVLFKMASKDVSSPFGCVVSFNYQ